MEDDGVHILGRVREGFSEEVAWSPDLCKVSGRVMVSLQGERSRQRIFSGFAPPSTIHLVAHARNLGVLMYPFPDFSSPQIHKTYLFCDLNMQLQTKLPGECDQNCCREPTQGDSICQLITSEVRELQEVFGE